VLEWVEGQLLRSLLNQRRTLEPAEAVRLISELCEALDFMHKHGVVHRDLKPENIMVTPEGRIKLIDFGIAMKEDARRITHAGLSPALGTPDYISPEQVKGQRGDQRSDIYALGILFFEMLTGHTPFEGPNPLAVMNERLMHDARPARELNPEVTAELQEVLDRALERDPRHRYATAGEMAWDLEHPEQLGLEPERGKKLGVQLPNRGRLLLYLALALVPLVLFVLMLLLARR
jgi:serine/threonine-protein kinase